MGTLARTTDPQKTVESQEKTPHRVLIAQGAGVDGEHAEDGESLEKVDGPVSFVCGILQGKSPLFRLFF